MKKKIFVSIALLALLAACDDHYDDQFNINTILNADKQREGHRHDVGNSRLRYYLQIERQPRAGTFQRPRRKDVCRGIGVSLY